MPPTPTADTARQAKQAWAATLAEARREAGRTQTDVAQAAGLNQKTVSNIERGEGPLETFLIVAHELGVTLFEVPS